MDGLEHQCCLLSLILETTFLFFVGTTIGVYVSGIHSHKLLLFKSTLRAVLDKYAIGVMLPDWVHCLWVATWVYILIWMLYSVTLLYRKPGDGKGYLYFRPPFVPLSVYLSFDASLFALVGWTFLWTSEEMRWSALAMLGAALFAFVSLIFSVRGAHFYADDLRRFGNGADVAMDHLIVQNSLAMYATWTMVLAVENLALALVHEWSLAELDATTVVLSSVGGLAAVYFVVDILVVDKDMSCVLTPYVVLAIVASGLLAKEFYGGDRNFLLALFLVGLTGFTALFKLASLVNHVCKDRPPHDEERRLLSANSDDEDESCDEDEDLKRNDEQTASYIKQARLLLSSK